MLSTSCFRLWILLESKINCKEALNEHNNIKKYPKHVHLSNEWIFNVLWKNVNSLLKDPALHLHFLIFFDCFFNTLNIWTKVRTVVHLLLSSTQCMNKIDKFLKTFFVKGTFKQCNYKKKFITGPLNVSQNTNCKY